MYPRLEQYATLVWSLLVLPLFMHQVYIPYRQKACYGLLVVNFREGKFQQVHCGRKEANEDGLDQIALDIVSQTDSHFHWFIKLLCI